MALPVAASASRATLPTVVEPAWDQPRRPGVLAGFSCDDPAGGDARAAPRLASQTWRLQPVRRTVASTRETVDARIYADAPGLYRFGSGNAAVLPRPGRVTHDLPSLMWLVSADGAGGTVVPALPSKENDMTPLWQLFVSGAVGSSLTYGFTWWREHKRMQDAYRAPQRQAIGDILAAAHELRRRNLDAAHAMEDMIELIRQDKMPTEASQLCATSSALGDAVLAAERAMLVGRLTIVDAPCWEGLAIASAALDDLTTVMRSKIDALPMDTVEEIEQYIDELDALIEKYGQAVNALVVGAADRLSPAESTRNRRDRRAARRRLSERFPPLD